MFYIIRNKKQGWEFDLSIFDLSIFDLSIFDLLIYQSVLSLKRSIVIESLWFIFYKDQLWSNGSRRSFKKIDHERIDPPDL